MGIAVVVNGGIEIPLEYENQLDILSLSSVFEELTIERGKEYLSIIFTSAPDNISRIIERDLEKISQKFSGATADITIIWTDEPGSLFHYQIKESVFTMEKGPCGHLLRRVPYPNNPEMYWWEDPYQMTPKELTLLRKILIEGEEGAASTQEEILIRGIREKLQGILESWFDYNPSKLTPVDLLEK